MWLQNTDREKRLLRVIRTPILNRDGDVLFLSCSAEDLTNAQPSETQTPSNWNESSEEFVQGKVQQLADALWGTITALVCLAESRDDNTGGHLRRISETCRVVATALSLNSVYSEQLTREFIINLQQACLLHDIGKVGIPDAILKKPGRLTPDEFEIMKTHAQIGGDTLRTVYEQYPSQSFIQCGMDVAYGHHEKWNGSGYPSGIQGEAIPLSAQILALVDVYDALTCRRVYKPPFPREQAKAMIAEGSGTHFSPDIVAAFLNNEAEFHRIAEQLADQP
jgi:putative two-component system response regulator